MYLSEIFEHLSYGELSQLFLGDSLQGSIQESQYGKIASFVNIGLVDLYKKFALREKEVIIQQYDTLNYYVLVDDYAVSNVASMASPKFILDSVEKPFINDVLQIQYVKDADGLDIPLNSLNQTNSIFTPEETVLHIPEPVNETLITVTYRVYPAKIALDNINPFAVTIDLPEFLLPALLSYVGYRAHIALPDGEASKALSYYGKYRKICEEVELLGLIHNIIPQNQKHWNNGWA